MASAGLSVCWSPSLCGSSGIDVTDPMPRGLESITIGDAARPLNGVYGDDDGSDAGGAWLKGNSMGVDAGLSIGINGE